MNEGQATAPAPAKVPQPKLTISKTRFRFIEEPKQPNKLLRFVARHRGWMSFLSAVIVFGTFILREGVRENMKEIDDTLYRKQEILLFKTDPLKLEPLRITPVSSEMATCDEEVFLKDTSLLLRQLTILQREAKLTDSGLNDLIEMFWSELGSIQTQGQNLIPAVEGRNTYPIGALEIIEHRMLNLAHMIEDLDSTLLVTRSLGITLAVDQAKRVEREFAIVTWISYFSFTLGLILGFVSNLAGVSAGGQE